ncbi:capsid protein [Giant panda associated gemycircularvirus]|uniref:Capsid protein n=1 Tax=Giant panda associated gemycircularvirus TaxID=2016461 RepID=A0A220IGS4_9VIRU|nr:capsid protein [Giant panda associated gemycircularvirus]ASH99176.1 capsid protein [Giant panda associated gemycircularvirus]
MCLTQDLQSWVEPPGPFSKQFGAQPHAPWNATGRPAENSDGQRGSKVDVSLRTSESIFAVGVKERITLETNNSAPWQWRRICFTSKDDFGQRDPDTSDYFRRTSNGMVRLVRAQNEVTYLQDQLFEGQRNQDLAATDRVTDVVFRGQNQTDWVNHFIAPIDTSKISLKFDRTRVIQSNNDSGTVRYYKDWFAMNKNIYYDDEESGDQTFPSMFSVENKQGMGDYYIYDIIEPQGGDSTDAMEFEPQARLYWHEN